MPGRQRNSGKELGEILGNGLHHAADACLDAARHHQIVFAEDVDARKIMADIEAREGRFGDTDPPGSENVLNGKRSDGDSGRRNSDR